MKIETKLGQISISGDVFTTITGTATSSCYGVKGMALTSKTDGLVHLLKRESMGKGVKITLNDDESISIELHIIVNHGVNLNAVCCSIMQEVSYVVTDITGVPVKQIQVYVDGMRF